MLVGLHQWGFWRAQAYRPNSARIIGLFISGAIATQASPVIGQIVPDNTLGDNASILVPDGGPTSAELNRSDRIEGGTIAGTNLFHSFQDFNIDADQGIYFANPSNIDLILTRVTGNNPSNLLGTLGVLGNADLFLLNPQGITFGPESSLDLRGSFLASTAESFVFADGKRFSASTPKDPSLLSVNVPSGLQFGTKPGDIAYQAERASRSQGLAVQPGRTLALIGGALAFQGADLEAIRGRIELGSVAEAGLVELLPIEQAWTFDYGKIQAFDDLNATLSSINTSTEERNDLLTSQVQDGDIVIQAQGITLKRSTLVRARTFTDLPAGDITIQARRLSLDGGSGISTTTSTTSQNDLRGNAGNILIEATEAVVLKGGLDIGGFFFSPTSINASVEGEFLDRRTGLRRGRVFGSGGSITINTQELSISEGALIGSLTRTRGNAGQVVINATKSVDIIGGSAGSLGFNRSAIAASNLRGLGNGGRVEINTQTVSIRDGGNLVAVTTGQGNAGTTVVNADTVEISGSAVPSPETPDRFIVILNKDKTLSGTVNSDNFI